MDMIRWLLRAKHWARRPPSMRRVIFMFMVLAISLGLYGIETYWGWPDWMTVDAMRRPIR